MIDKELNLIKVDWTFYKIFKSSRLLLQIEPAKTGILIFRKNVSDISIGDKKYAQVRILVDNKWILKGLAMPSDDIPEGYDIVAYIDPDNFNVTLKSIERYDGIKLYIGKAENNCIITVKGDIND